MTSTSSVKFQALIGTAKTDARGREVERRSVVSSPHRYCQNLLLGREGHARLTGFKPS